MSSWHLSLSRDINISRRVMWQMSVLTGHNSQKRTCFTMKLNIVQNTGEKISILLTPREFKMK